MFGDGRRWREDHTPRGAHSPREIGSVSQHRRGVAAGRRVVGAVFARPFGGVTLSVVAVLEIDSYIRGSYNQRAGFATFFNACFKV